MPSLSITQLTVTRLKPAKASGANPSSPVKLPSAPRTKLGLRSAEPRVRSTGLITSLREPSRADTGTGSQAGGCWLKNVLVELSESETCRAEETRLWHPCLRHVWGSSRLSRSCSSSLNLRCKCRTARDPTCCCWRVSNPLCAAFYALW